MIEESINELIRNVANLVITSGYAIKANQDAPRPRGSYASIKTNLPQVIGTADISLSNNGSDDVDRKIDTLRETTVSINTYRSNAFDNAIKISNAFEREDVRELMRAANTGFIDSSAARLLPQEIDGGNEERAQFDIRLYVLGSDTEVVKAINEVIVNTEYHVPGYVYNDTIGVQ